MPGLSIAGFGSCGRQRSPDLAEAGFDGEFQAIYVLQAAQRRGVGRALMAEMARDLVSRGFQGGALWVLDGNRPARGFYEALGGHVIGAREDRRDKDLTLAEVAYGWASLGTIGAGP